MSIIFLNGCLAALCALLTNGEAARRLPGEKTCLSLGCMAAILLALSFYAALLALSERPWFSGLAATALCLALWRANALKLAILGEPLLFSDILMTGSALRFPHLYFDHIPGHVLLLALAGTAGLAIFFLLEPPAPLSGAARLLAAELALVPWLCLVLLTCRPFDSISGHILKHFPLSFSPCDDAARYTPLGAMFLHTLHQARRNHTVLSFPQPKRQTAAAPRAGESLPHLLLVQAESFGPLSPFTGEEHPLPHIDRAERQGAGGALALRWSGANTMRTEFAALTGISIDALETDGFDPYRLAARRVLPSLAHDARALGYKTVCLHPHDIRFFRRDLVMKNLGFDCLLDERFFKDEERNGPYVSDAALLKRALQLLQEAEQPMFLFVITMEAHGPWLAGRFPETSWKNASPLACYIRHLHSLDRGVGTVLESVASLQRELIFCLYGDHLPSLPRRPESKNSLDTRWFLWPQNRIPTSLPQRIAPQELRTLLLSCLTDQSQAFRGSSCGV
ncbi:MAG: LTA synthase family protein [Deltaproteobacteria bacterium]|nr:LTA synthase family protein [Deltaproteobacteria bacterium]